MRTKVESHFKEKSTSIYTDDGAFISNKQYYTFEQARAYNLTNKDYISYLGLNSYASIYGTTLKTNNNDYLGITFWS